jgi:8-oxo-dGTP diphosphatase
VLPVAGSNVEEPLRVAFTVVIDGPHVLLVRRRDRGIWSWPAAMVAPGRNPAEVAVAKTLAETGVHVSVRHMLGERLHPKLHAYCSYWLCDRQGGLTQNRQPEDHLAVEWVLRKQISDYIPRDDIFPPVQVAIADLGPFASQSNAPKNKATVVHAIIVHDQRVLMIRRAKVEGNLIWAFPAGQQEDGEDFEGTAIRETLEEVGLVVLPTANLGRRIHPLTNRDMVYVACRVVGGSARVASPEEVAEVDWADLATVRQRLQALGIFPPVAEYLEQHLRVP